MPKKNAKKVTRAKCARGTTVKQAVPVAGGALYALVRYCTTKKGRVVVKGKRFSSKPGDYAPKAPAPSRRRRHASAEETFLPLVPPPGHDPYDDEGVQREFEPAYYGD